MFALICMYIWMYFKTKKDMTLEYYFNLLVMSY